MNASPRETYDLLMQTRRERVSDGATVELGTGTERAARVLVWLWPQLGDFDSLEAAWWLQRERALLGSDLAIRAVGIGNRAAGDRFCAYTGFPTEHLFVEPTAELHCQLDLYRGLQVAFPGLSAGQRAWLNLLLMCAGIGSPGTLREVLRGYTGDRAAPQLIRDEEVVRARPLPPLTGEVFQAAGGKGFQRPFELATLRLRNMGETLSHWNTYVPDARYLTQRGGVFLFARDGTLLYEHRDRGILGFAANMSRPLAALHARS